MTLVNRVLNRQPETEDDLLPNMTVWTDNANPKAWYYLAVQEATNSHYYKFKTNSKYEKWTELRETRDWTQLEKQVKNPPPPIVKGRTARKSGSSFFALPSRSQNPLTKRTFLCIISTYL